MGIEVAVLNSGDRRHHATHRLGGIGSSQAYHLSDLRGPPQTAAGPEACRLDCGHRLLSGRESGEDLVPELP
jgi:hypothetical protein